MSKRGLLIVLDGIEGTGKTTQITKIAQQLKEHWPDKEIVITREPGSTDIGKLIRAILLNPDHTSLAHKAEMFLYAADRAQHIAEFIQPALDRGAIVLSDRYADCTRVYQGYGRQMDRDIIEKVVKLTIGDLEADLTIIFDQPVEVGLERANLQLILNERDEEETRFENEKHEFLERCRYGYLELLDQYPDRFTVVNANQPIGNVTRQCMLAIIHYINKQNRLKEML